MFVVILDYKRCVQAREIISLSEHLERRFKFLWNARPAFALTYTGFEQVYTFWVPTFIYNLFRFFVMFCLLVYHLWYCLCSSFFHNMILFMVLFHFICFYSLNFTSRKYDEEQQQVKVPALKVSHYRLSYFPYYFFYNIDIFYLHA